MKNCNERKQCICGNSTDCNEISAAFGILGDPRCEYVEIPLHRDNPKYSFTCKMNGLRSAYLRHISPSVIDKWPGCKKNKEQPQSSQQRKQFIAMHHFHPKVVQDFANEADNMIFKVPPTISQSEMENLEMNLGIEDRVFDDSFQPTTEYYFVPNYTMINTRKDLEVLLRQSQNILTNTLLESTDKHVDGDDIAKVPEKEQESSVKGKQKDQAKKSCSNFNFKRTPLQRSNPGKLHLHSQSLDQQEYNKPGFLHSVNKYIYSSNDAESITSIRCLDQDSNNESSGTISFLSHGSSRRNSIASSDGMGSNFSKLSDSFLLSTNNDNENPYLKISSPAAGADSILAPPPRHFRPEAVWRASHVNKKHSPKLLNEDGIPTMINLSVSKKDMMSVISDVSSVHAFDKRQDWKNKLKNSHSHSNDHVVKKKTGSRVRHSAELDKNISDFPGGDINDSTVRSPILPDIKSPRQNDNQKEFTRYNLKSKIQRRGSIGVSAVPDNNNDGSKSNFRKPYIVPTQDQSRTHSMQHKPPQQRSSNASQYVLVTNEFSRQADNNDDMLQKLESLSMINAKPLPTNNNKNNALQYKEINWKHNDTIGCEHSPSKSSSSSTTREPLKKSSLTSTSHAVIEQLSQTAKETLKTEKKILKILRSQRGIFDRS